MVVQIAALHHVFPRGYALKVYLSLKKSLISLTVFFHQGLVDVYGSVKLHNGWYLICLALEAAEGAETGAQFFVSVVETAFLPLIRVNSGFHRVVELSGFKCVDRRHQ